MSPRVLHINFKLNVPRAEYEDIARGLASDFARVPGLRWKVWTLNEAEGEAGGVYLFEDEVALDTFLAGPLAAAVTAHPAVSDLVATQFEVLEDCTAVTHGPIEHAHTA